MAKTSLALSRARRFAMVVGATMLLTDFVLSFRTESAQIPAAENASLHTPSGRESRSAQTAAAKARVQQKKLERNNSHLGLTRMENDLCRIQRDTAIPLDQDLRVQFVERADGSRSYWLKSSTCPDELYSIVNIDREGRIEKEISCQNTGLTELTLNSGLQFTIMKVVPSSDVYAVAIAGQGRLLVNCPDTGLTITRDGFFHRRSGLLKNSEGCVAWTRRDGGRPIRLAHDEHVDEKGCTPSGQECFEVLEPDERDVDAFNFKTKNSLSVINARGLRAVRDAHVYEDSVEDLDSVDRSLTGVANWEPLKPAAIRTDCPR